MVKITVIIPTYDNIDYLRLCCESLEGKNFIIAINGTDMKTLEWVLKQNHRFVYQTKLGMYSANNLAAKEVDEGYLFFVNDDCYFSREWEENLKKWVKPNEIYCAYSIQPEPAGGVFSMWSDFGTNNINFDKKGFLNYASFMSQKQITSFLAFGLPCIHNKIFKKVGGFDELFDPYGGGTNDLLYRCFLEGVREFWTPHDVLIYHFITKGAKKHNNYGVKGIDVLNKFTNKWGKEFGEVDKIIKKECLKNVA